MRKVVVTLVLRLGAGSRSTPHTLVSFRHGSQRQRCPKRQDTPAHQDVSAVRPPVHVAQEMGS